MKRIFWSSIASLIGLVNIIEGVIAKNWLDFIGGLVMVGVGGRYVAKRSKASVVLPSTEMNEAAYAEETPELTSTESDQVYLPTGYIHRFSRMTTKAKVSSISILLLIAGVTAYGLHVKANNTAKSIVASNQAQLKFIKSLTGKTPDQINTIACTNAISSIAKITKGGSKGKTVGDGINEYNALSVALNQVSEYALPPLLVPVKNLALASQEAATALDGDSAAQNTAGTDLIASIKDFDAACTNLGFNFPAIP